MAGVTIEWLCTPPSETNFPGHADACEQICRDAAQLNGWTVVGIRQLDHRTTRITTRRGRNRRTVPTDPHITVYVGDETPIRQNYIGEGHFYIVYGQDRLPRRLARVSELRILRTGVNPEIWGSDRRLMRTIGAQS